MRGAGSVILSTSPAMRVVLALFVCCPIFAGEYAVLASGFRLHADSHRQEGNVLFLKANGGEMQMPASDVVRFEADDAVPPAAAAPVAAPTPAPVQDTHRLVDMAADATALPRNLVHSIAKAESAYNAQAVSPRGAIGLMQLMPATASTLSVDPENPAQNAYAGALYLRQLLVKYNGSVSRAVAAYNAGPGAVDKYKGVPPYRETRAYVRRVLTDYERSSGAAAKPAKRSKTSTGQTD